MDLSVPAERYGEILKEYLQKRGERQLFEASLLSNRFVEAGVGPDEIIALHVEALEQALQGSSYREQARAIGDAHQFLLDVMIAYGLKYREYFELKSRENARDAETRDEMLATVAHELRSPLAAATISLDVASRNLTRGNVERLPPLIGSAKEALSRLSRLTANLVRISQRQHTPLTREVLDLVPLLIEACNWAQPAANEKGVVFVMAEGTTSLCVLGEADALLSIVGNLLSNAIRYTLKGGRVGIAWGVNTDTAWVEVRDTGIGMSEEIKDRIFEKFYRAREARDIEAQGLGLGLTLVHQLVLAHEGRIEVESQPNQGSIFRITLPLAPTMTQQGGTLTQGDDDKRGIAAAGDGAK